MQSVVPQVIEALNREVLNELALTKAIAHPGEGGRAREQVLSSFLKRIVPREYGVSTGFVIDGCGGISRQIDVVIYRTSYHPVITIGGVDHFLVESVAAAIEVKAAIGSRETLAQALENVASVKALDRTCGGTNYLLPHGTPVDRDEFQHQVFGAVVTEQSMTTPNLGQALMSFIAPRDRRLWPNLYVDVHRLTFGYRPAAGGMGAIPRTADALVVWEGERAWPPLVELAFEVANLLRVAPLIDYSPIAYFGSGDAGPLTGYDVSGFPLRPPPGSTAPPSE